MSESRKFDRRTLLKVGAGIAVGGAFGAHAIEHEHQLSEEGRFETADAIWYPLYERHDQHTQVLTPNHIPSDLNALSLEGIIQTHVITGDKQAADFNMLQAPMSSLLTENVVGHDTTPHSEQPLIPKETLEYLQAKDIPIAFGDVWYIKDEEAYAMNLEEAFKTREKIGKLFAALGTGVAAAGQLMKQRVDRRGVMRIGGAMAAALGMGLFLPVIDKRKEIIHGQVMQEIKENNPSQRIWARLGSISHDMLPEYLNDFFREVMQANKLLTLANNLNGAIGKKPSIGYNWHLEHMGIEDWLQLGPAFTRAIILAYPDTTLQNVIQANNNDPRCLYAIRLADVPKSLQIVSQDDTGVVYTWDPKEKVEDRIIEDQTLKQQLHNRGLV